MAQNCCAPTSVRRQPEIFCRSLTILISRSGSPGALLRRGPLVMPSSDWVDHQDVLPVVMTGLVSQHTRRTSVGQGNNSLSRGDTNRNSRLVALRAVLPADHAVLGIDLAQSRQAAA